MEHFWHWLIVLVNKTHIPIIAGIHFTSKNQGKSNSLDLGDMGDNVPYVFFVRGLEK